MPQIYWTNSVNRYGTSRSGEMKLLSKASWAKSAMQSNNKISVFAKNLRWWLIYAECWDFALSYFTFLWSAKLVGCSTSLKSWFIYVNSQVITWPNRTNPIILSDFSVRTTTNNQEIPTQSNIFCLLHEKLRTGWKENLKNLSEHALLLIFY